MLKVLIPAAIASLIAITPASAMSPAQAGTQLQPLSVSDLVQVASRDRYRARRDRHRHSSRRHHRNRWHYVPGRRYSHAPRGWRRYHHRPHYWRTRGCIIVGPVWFCP